MRGYVIKFIDKIDGESKYYTGSWWGYKGTAYPNISSNIINAKTYKRENSALKIMYFFKNLKHLYMFKVIKN